MSFKRGVDRSGWKPRRPKIGAAEAEAIRRAASASRTDEELAEVAERFNISIHVARRMRRIGSRIR